MQLLGLLLLLLNIGAFAVPMSGVILMHTNDLSELIIPEDIEEIVTNTIGTQESIELPQYVSSSIDPITRTAQVVFTFTNPFEFDLTVNMVAANIKCFEHNILLGTAQLDSTVEISPKETEQIIINFVWSPDAETHFLTQHADEVNVDVRLVDLELDVSGVEIEVPEEILISLPISEV